MVKAENVNILAKKPTREFISFNLVNYVSPLRNRIRIYKLVSKKSNRNSMRGT